MKRLALVAAVAATAATMLGLDLLWLGAIARGFYDGELGTLRRDDVFWPAALAFYGLYVTAIVWHAVAGASDNRSAMLRGARLGLLAYGTYELTNWAVLRGWPGALVPVDIAWGVVLTALAAGAGRRAHDAMLSRDT